MQVDEVTDVPTFIPNIEFLSAEQLVSLRKPTEETPQSIIGKKLNVLSKSSSELQALECALESYRATLNKNRAGRICDLMQAEWNPEQNITTVSKLKGKFTQHMGRSVNGKHVLAPEEAVFLFENNCIEIINGRIPMSTEEIFINLLKGNSGLEKYQVYSNLSKLGFVVVPHQVELGVTRHEKEMNLDKFPIRKRHPKESAEGEPEKKRLTFTGALSGESIMKSAMDNSGTASERQIDLICSTSIEESQRPDESECAVTESSFDESNMQCHSHEQNGDRVLIEKVAEDIQSDIDQINNTSAKNTEFEAELQNEDPEVLQEISSLRNSNSVKKNGEAIEIKENVLSNEVISQNQPTDQSTENSESQNDFPSKNNEIQNDLDGNSQSSKIVDVMDVDTDAELSCSTSEVSKDNFSNQDTNVNETPQDSCFSVNNDDTTVADTNAESNFDVLSMSCSSSADEDEVLAVDARSADSFSGEGDDDDDVRLLEVTKKEIKPLAVIDLLSDDDESEAIDVDDDITVLDEYPSSSMTRSTASIQIRSKKLNGCKKEEAASTLSSSKLIPPWSGQFPDLHKKSVVCVARPPLNLLPNHVKPSKEAYVLNLKQNKPDQPSNSNRLWGSYRELQEYQRQRRQNRHQNNISRGQSFSGAQTWNDKNSRNCERINKSGFGSNGVNSAATNSNSRSPRFFPPTESNRNLTLPYENSFPLPSRSTMNREITIKEDVNESGVSGQTSHSNNFSFSSGMPSNSLTNPMVPGSNFMTSVHRHAYSMGPANFMAELHRTCFTVATSVLTSMLNGDPLLPSPPNSMLTHGVTPPGVRMGNGFSAPASPGCVEYFTVNQRFNDNQRRFRGRPFPCRYRHIARKRSWNDVRSAVRDLSSDSEIEEVPISPREILWDNKDIRPLVKPGVRYPIGSVLKFLQVTQKAKVTSKYGYSDKFLPSTSSLEISFDVYIPGFEYKKTCPQIPKYRIVVAKSTDPLPKYSDIALLQRQWNDGATLLIAVNDNGDINFQSFNSISLPLLMPHED